ncbi:hypothetical protein B0H66DRAFT_324951 [Apodospora peruviana]|uniref:Uncharacterized protein n=1 Tax=Apodospora peruviana TaxID=516989 RepID=A0AAE0M0Z9_9PEZI|nr:hypothetical protein B0H66DRAFT_324951 [Apodospora peruviana]
MYRPQYLVESDDESWPEDDDDYDPESDANPSSAASDSDEGQVEADPDGDDDDDDLDPEALRRNVQGGFYDNEQSWGRKGRVCCHDYHDDGQCCCERNRAAFCQARFPPDIFALRRLETESMVPYLPFTQSVVQQIDRDPAIVPYLLQELKEIYRLYEYEADLNTPVHLRRRSPTWADQHPLAIDGSAAEIFMRVRETNRRNGQWVRVVEWPR